jgi:parallel beta helix pectate lyase-like protein
MPFKRDLSRTFFIVALLVLLAGCTPGLISGSVEFYVSTSGSDANDGSQASPWRHVQYGIDQLGSYSGLRFRRLYVSPGTYVEKLRIKNAAMAIVGTGTAAAPVTIRHSEPPHAGGPVDEDYVVIISNNVDVTLNGLRIDGQHGSHPGILVSGARAQLRAVEVIQPWAFGIVIRQSPEFTIEKSSLATTVKDATGTSSEAADLAVNILDSIGTITDLIAGDRFDHIINVNPGANTTVRISNSNLTGSTVYYADGIRIQGPADVTVENTVLFRPSGAEPANTGPVHNPPYAGIEVAGSKDLGKLVFIRNNIITGFDVGIGINLVGNRLRIEGNRVSNNIFAAVDTTDCCRSSGGPPGFDVAPVVDLGGGALRSSGGNYLQGGQYAFYHRGPYDVPARGNDWWAQTPAQIEARIWDKLDDPRLGRVHSTEAP